MISYIDGDLFTSPAKVLVNTVNTVGVMGKGIALQFKGIFPDMFAQYQQLCESKQLTVGKLWLYRTPHKWVLNFPTKQHWRNPSRPEFVEAGLNKFVATYAELGITSIAFPRLGCGNGELDWEQQVRPLMEKHLDRLPIDVFVYLASRGRDAPEHVDPEATKRWLRSQPRNLGFVEVWDDLVAAIGTELELERWGADEKFTVKVVNEPEEGLVIEQRTEPKPPRTPLVHILARIVAPLLPERWKLKSLGPTQIFVPREAIVDLWQNVRTYGFCVPNIMPGGLAAVASYLLPPLARLGYLTPVRIRTPTAQSGSTDQVGLQFVGPNVGASSRAERPAETVHAA